MIVRAKQFHHATEADEGLFPVAFERRIAVAVLA
jgi:hypothetical protein